MTTGRFAMLIAAVVFGGAYLLAKVLADEVKPSVVVAMMSLLVTLFLVPFVVPVWIAPTWSELGLLATVACFATAGHYTMTLAFAAAPLTVTQPVTGCSCNWLGPRPRCCRVFGTGGCLGDPGRIYHCSVGLRSSLGAKGDAEPCTDHTTTAATKF